MTLVQSEWQTLVNNLPGADAGVALAAIMQDCDDPTWYEILEAVQASYKKGGWKVGELHPYLLDQLQVEPSLGMEPNGLLSNIVPPRTPLPYSAPNPNILHWGTEGQKAHFARCVQNAPDPEAWVEDLWVALQERHPLVRGLALHAWEHSPIAVGRGQEWALERMREGGVASYRAALALRSRSQHPAVISALGSMLRSEDPTAKAMAEYALSYRSTQHPRQAPPGWHNAQHAHADLDRTVDLGSDHPMFVYGTLRCGMHNYNTYLRGFTRLEQQAVGTDLGLYSTGIGFVSDSPYDTVRGELMWLQQETRLTVMSGVDSLEGFSPEGKYSSLYKRVLRPFLAYDADGQPYVQQAWIYVTPPSDQGVAPDIRQQKFFVPSGDWFDTLS